MYKTTLKLIGYRQEHHTARFSPNGRILAATDYNGIYLFEAHNGALVKRYSVQNTSGISSCQFINAHRNFIAAHEDGTMSIWNTRISTPITTFIGHTKHIWDVSISRDSKWIATASEDKSVVIWNATTARPMKIFRHPKLRLTSCTFSPDGSKLIVGSHSFLIIWDIASGKEKIIHCHDSWINSCVCSKDGKYILTASDDWTLQLTDLHSGCTIKVFEGHDHKIEICAFSPDESLILSGAINGGLILWDSDTTRIITKFDDHYGAIDSCSFSPDGTKILSSSWGTGVIVRCR